MKNRRIFSVKKEYLKRRMKGYSSYALTIKLADRLDNVSDNPTQKTIEDTIEIMSFIRKERKLSKTQKNIIQEIERICADYENSES